MKRILVPSDFSAQSNAAFKTAIELAGKGKVKYSCSINMLKALDSTGWRRDTHVSSGLL